MRTNDDAFHLAIPTHNLDEAETFYAKLLGCKLARRSRRYDDRITLDFFGDQLVCHLSDRIDENPQMYPRHFGITFRHREDFDALVRLARVRGLTFFAEPSQRFEGLVEEHSTFVLADRSRAAFRTVT